MARPVWTPSDAQRRAAETMAAYGIPEADIARVLGVSKPTLRKHCGIELDTGATRANSKVADFLFYGICGGTGKPAFKDERARVTAAIFWMKTRGGWSETSTHKHTGAANGDPIEGEVVTVRERLTRRIPRIAAARTTGGVPETDECSRRSKTRCASSRRTSTVRSESATRPTLRASAWAGLAPRRTPPMRWCGPSPSPSSKRSPPGASLARRARAAEETAARAAKAGV